MSDELDEIKSLWKAAKQSAAAGAMSTAQMIDSARKHRRSSIYFQYGNIAILMAVLVLISSFFYWLAPMQEWLSRVGIALMVGGLSLRILIEMFSVFKSRQIDLTDDAVKNTDDTYRYFRFRKLIHGPVTISIVAAYTIGFYILTPEFSQYISPRRMVAINLSYLVGAVFLIWQIRKGIRQEMEDLSALISLEKELKGNQSDE